MKLKSLNLPKSTVIKLTMVAMSALLFPMAIKDDYLVHLVIMSLIWGAVAINWNLTFGFGGMFHIAQCTFFAVGSYGAGIGIAQLGMSPWTGLLFGGLAAFASSLIIGLPSLRIKGIYLILFTFAFHFVAAEMVIHFEKYTGGVHGLVVQTYALGNYEFSPLNLIPYYYLGLLLVTITLISARFIMKSSYGKALIATRDSELMAVCGGVNLYKCRLVVFTLAAFLTGIIGAFYASYLMATSPEVFSFGVIVNVLAMMIVGGMQFVYGPLVGAFIMTILTELFRTWEAYRVIIFGVILISVLIFMPLGILAPIEGMVAKSWKLMISRFRPGSYKA